MIPVLVAGVVVGGLAYGVLSRGKPAGSGWSKANSGIVLGARQSAYLDRLAKCVPFAIVVTSGTRTAEGQARAMLAMADLGEAGKAQMIANYDDGLVATLLALPRDLAAWTKEVAAAYADGRLSRGGHYDGGAVDLRTHDLSAAQVKVLQAAVVATGGTHWLESAPAHLHVNLPKP